MTRATFDDVTTALSRAGVPTRELHGHGHAAVTLAAGRVVALSFERGGPNLLWSNPLLDNSDLVKHQADKLIGGYGGDRLWFAPELQFHWKGIPDWAAV